MPLTVVITRYEIDRVRLIATGSPPYSHRGFQCLAWVFLIGSSASTATTLCFLYVLVCFPIFIRHVKEEGADPDVVFRLTTFYDLNVSGIYLRAAVVPNLAICPVRAGGQGNVSVLVHHSITCARYRRHSRST